MDTERNDDAPTSEAERLHQSGLPGDGKGRIEQPGRSGVYPASGPPPPDPNALARGMASWGQGERGAAGYEDHGDSEVIAMAPGGGSAGDEHPGKSAGGDQGRTGGQHDTRES